MSGAKSMRLHLGNEGSYRVYVASDGMPFLKSCRYKQRATATEWVEYGLSWRCIFPDERVNYWWMKLGGKPKEVVC